MRHVKKEMYKSSVYHNLLTKKLFRQDCKLTSAASTWLQAYFLLALHQRAPDGRHSIPRLNRFTLAL